MDIDMIPGHKYKTVKLTPQEFQFIHNSVHAAAAVLEQKMEWFPLNTVEEMNVLSELFQTAKLLESKR